MGFTLFDYIAIGIAIVAVLIVLIDHFHFKPRRKKRQEKLEHLYVQNMKELIKQLNKEN